MSSTGCCKQQLAVYPPQSLQHSIVSMFVALAFLKIICLINRNVCNAFIMFLLCATGSTNSSDSFVQKNCQKKTFIIQNNCHHCILQFVSQVAWYLVSQHCCKDDQPFQCEMPNHYYNCSPSK